MTEFLIRRFVKDHEQIEKLSVRTSYGVLSSFVGIFCNALLFLIKIVIGIWTHSIAVIADAFNNLSDAVASVISLVGVRMASKPADKDHPFGHGRIEYIAALIVSIFVIEVGINFFRDAVKLIRYPENLQFHAGTVVFLFLTIGVKLWLGVFNRKLGKRIDSKVMMAAATDSMGDVLATSATIISILVYAIADVNIDGFVGIGVSAVVIWAGFGIAKDTIEPLLGQAVPKEVFEKITTFVESYDGILGSHDLIVHNYGPGRSMASVHAEVSNEENIEISHEIIDRIERDVLRELGIYLVIHMDPIEVNNEELEKMRSEVLQVVEGLDSALTIHDFRIVQGEQQINLIFDLVVPAAYDKETRNDLCQMIRRKMNERNAKYQCVIQVESSFVAEEK